jgi:hypothetical protein
MAATCAAVATLDSDSDSHINVGPDGNLSIALARISDSERYVIGRPPERANGPRCSFFDRTNEKKKKNSSSLKLSEMKALFVVTASFDI